ncbi:arginine repressor [Tepidibacter formicigenes]|uniref:Arginine repressor n=1 Tax=Tepidibacter formicigenes DSM 15518 TaxID=1123349 RepID=A0A1M6L1W7_9FIRM|nr:arginine repressor [Tepidibacter formicigenes]SHJ65220.1 transcriptional regulator, ArgR family [Tepidibacter formicigenes DSM 15518]
MKISRHSKILEIIENEEIETQDDLAQRLRDNGINVTQATVSRDIKELKLVKVLTRDGRYKYAALKKEEKGSSDRLIRLIKEVLVDLDSSENIVCLKTVSGSAQLVARAIDELDLREIVGTIAGMDTVFVLIKNIEYVEKIKDRFRKLI